MMSGARGLSHFWWELLGPLCLGFLVRREVKTPFEGGPFDQFVWW